MAPTSTRRKPTRSRPTPITESSAEEPITAASPLSARSPKKALPRSATVTATKGDQEAEAPSQPISKLPNGGKRKRDEHAANDEETNPSPSPKRHSPTLSPPITTLPPHQPSPSPSPSLTQSPDPDLPLNHLLNSHYRITSLLGRGNFSTTYLTLHIPSNNIYALKRYHATWTQAGRAEALLLSHLPTSQNIVTYHSHFTDNTGHICILLEPLVPATERPLALPPCPHQPGKHSATRCPDRLKILAIILSQILTGLHTLHKFGIAHADLTLQNILYTSTSPNSHDVKIIDFSNSIPVTPRVELTSPDDYELQTPCYRAPEILLGSAKEVTTKIDIWSVGIIALEILLAGSGEDTVRAEGVERGELMRAGMEGREGMVRRLVEVVGSVKSCSEGQFWRGVFGEVSVRWGMHAGVKVEVGEKSGWWRGVVDNNFGDWLAGLVEVAEGKRWNVEDALRGGWLVRSALGEWGEVLMTAPPMEMRHEQRWLQHEHDEQEDDEDVERVMLV